MQEPKCDCFNSESAAKIRKGHVEHIADTLSQMMTYEAARVGLCSDTFEFMSAALLAGLVVECLFVKMVPDSPVPTNDECLSIVDRVALMCKERFNHAEELRVERLKNPLNNMEAQGNG